MVGAVDGQRGCRLKLDAALGTIVGRCFGYLGLFLGGGAGRALRLLLPASVTCSVQQRAAVHAQPLSSPACSHTITVGWVLGPQHTHHWPPPFPPVLRAAGGPAARTGQSDSNTSYEQFRAARASPPPLSSHAVSQCLRLTVSQQSSSSLPPACVQPKLMVGANAAAAGGGALTSARKPWGNPARCWTLGPWSHCPGRPALSPHPCNPPTHHPRTLKTQNFNGAKKGRGSNRLRIGCLGLL